MKNAFFMQGSFFFFKDKGWRGGVIMSAVLDYDIIHGVIAAQDIKH
jgi:hypothetical protein